MTQTSYDLVVTSDDLGALVTAALCARRGLRTLVLTPRVATGKYSLGPHRITLDPVVWPLASATIGAAIRELGLEHALKRKLREPEPTACVVSAQQRFALGDQLPRELGREFGGPAADTLTAAWHNAGTAAQQLGALLVPGYPRQGFFERREAQRLCEQLVETAARYVTELRESPAPWLHHVASLLMRSPQATPIAVARALDLLRSNISSFVGELDLPREYLLEKLATANVELRVGRVAAVDLAWGKAQGLTLEDGTQLGVGHWLCGESPAELLDILGKKASRALREQAHALTPLGYRYMLALVIDESGLPEGMPPIVFCSPDLNPDDTAPPFLLQYGQPDNEGRVFVHITAYVEARAVLALDDQVVEARALRQRLWPALRSLMPFFEEHLVLVHSPHDGLPPKGQGDVGAGPLLPMRPVWAHREDPIATVPPATGLKNVSFGGDQALAGLGLEGAFASARALTELICQASGKKAERAHVTVRGESNY